ncbi:MAG: LysM peptidoglycan-binding domain-containing M23 family metallopeptidase [Nitrospinota bacterium]
MALCLLLAGCSAAGLFRRPGVYHVIRPGETLYRISRTYGVDLETLVKVNHIADARRIVAGTRLFIPGARRTLRVPPPRRRAAGRAPSQRPPPWPGRERKAPKPPPAPTGRVALPAEVDFNWPVRGRVTSLFGRRGKSVHQGIDIAAKTGTPIQAAEDGLVIFSGRGPGGYGFMLILRHPNGFHTIYAHNHKNLVRKGQRVRQGEVIGLVGSTGRSTGPHLHFEIRNRTKPKDPLFYLP